MFFHNESESKKSMVEMNQQSFDSADDTYDVKDLTPNKAYKFSMRYTTEVGDSPYSEWTGWVSLHVHTK